MRILGVGNGCSVHVQARLRAMAERGHAVTLLTETPSNANGLPQIAPPPDGGAIAALWCLYRGLARQSADVIHVHYAAGYGAWMTVLAGRGTLVVSVMGGDILPEEQVAQGWVERWLTRALLRSADLVTSKSAYLTERIIALGVAPDRIVPLVWGVDQRVFHPMNADALRARLGFVPEDEIILSPRSLRPFYNIHLIAEAFIAVVRQRPQARLVITGYQADSDYAETIRAAMTSAGIAERVVFVGAVQPREMVEYYSLASVVVSIPESDGMPQSLLEALACGTPVILSRLSRYDEMVRDRESAVFVSPVADEVAKACLDVLDDQELRDRLVSNGRDVIRAKADLVANLERLESALAGLPAVTGSRRSGWRRLLVAGALAALVCGRGLAAIFRSSR